MHVTYTCPSKTMVIQLIHSQLFFPNVHTLYWYVHVGLAKLLSLTSQTSPCEYAGYARFT